VLSWLFVGLLVIIWGFFLLPTRARSPAASVEDFEQRMSLLAETHRDSPGRWVLMPRRRFLDPRDRVRARVLRRRRNILTLLLEATGLFLLMGLVPPLHMLLFVAGGLAFMTLVYSAVLVQIKSTELERARRQMRRSSPEAASRREAAARMTYPQGFAPEAVYRGAGTGAFEATYGSGRSAGRAPGNARAGSANGTSNGAGNGHGSGNGNGNGHPNGNGHANGVAAHGGSPFDEGILELIDDDVHVIIRRADEIAVEAEPMGSARSACGS
jgi:hypothetical protein